MLDNENVGHQIPFLPLSNDTVRRHIDETAKDVQSQLNDIIQTINFSSLEEFEIAKLFFWDMQDSNTA